MELVVVAAAAQTGAAAAVFLRIGHRVVTVGRRREGGRAGVMERIQWRRGAELKAAGRGRREREWAAGVRAAAADRNRSPSATPPAAARNFQPAATGTLSPSAHCRRMPQPRSRLRLVSAISWSRSRSRRRSRKEKKKAPRDGRRRRCPLLIIGAASGGEPDGRGGRGASKWAVDAAACEFASAFEFAPPCATRRWRTSIGAPLADRSPLQRSAPSQSQCGGCGAGPPAPLLRLLTRTHTHMRVVSEDFAVGPSPPFVPFRRPPMETKRPQRADRIGLIAEEFEATRPSLCDRLHTGPRSRRTHGVATSAAQPIESLPRAAREIMPKHGDE